MIEEEEEQEEKEEEKDDENEKRWRYKKVLSNVLWWVVWKDRDRIETSHWVRSLKQ